MSPFPYAVEEEDVAAAEKEDDEEMEVADKEVEVADNAANDAAPLPLLLLLLFFSTASTSSNGKAGASLTGPTCLNIVVDKVIGVVVGKVIR